MLGRCEQESISAAPISTRAADNSARSRYVRGTALLDPLLLENIPLDDRNEALLGSAKYRNVGSGSTEFIEILGSNTTSDDRNNTSAQMLQTIPLADVDFLVQSYFDVVHPVFPILDQHVFRASYTSRSIEPLLLAAVCVVSKAWLSTTRRMPKETNLSDIELMLWGHLQASLDRPCIADLQAGLLLLQCPSDHTSRQLSSQLISAAFDIGLHHDCSDWKLDPGEISSRKRLAWALYAQDKWSALLHGWPAQMTAANWMVKGVAEEDFDVFTDPEDDSSSTGKHGALLFMQMLVLSQLLAEILDTFYTLSAEDEVRSSGHDGLKVVLQRAKSVQIKLKDWFSHLPADLKMDAQDVSQVAYNGVLHLAYFATEIGLHRCIIRASAAPGTDFYVAHICRSAAKTRLISAMEFVNRLRPFHFRCAWPLVSASNFGLIGSFGVLLRATAPTDEEAKFYRARLEEYRWTLAVNSRDAGFLDSAIHSLDTRTELLQYVPQKPEIAEFVAMNPGMTGGRGQGFDAQGSAFATARDRSCNGLDGFSSPASSTSSEQNSECIESA